MSLQVMIQVFGKNAHFGSKKLILSDSKPMSKTNMQNSASQNDYLWNFNDNDLLYVFIKD